ILLVETVFDTLNAKAALFAIDELKEELNSDIPVMISGTITDASGRTLSGQTAEAFLISISHILLLSAGFNCALGAKQLTTHLEVLARKCPYAVSTYPYASVNNVFDEYYESVAKIAEQINRYLEKGRMIIIVGRKMKSPAHIRAIAEIDKDNQPRPIPGKELIHAEV